MNAAIKAVSKSAGPTAADLEEQVMSVIRDLVGADVAKDQPLVAQGLDSLASMELRQKLQVKLHSTPILALATFSKKDFL